jgi:hypothetical protein
MRKQYQSEVIQQTDKTIDVMMYALYDLTEEGIRIAETAS